MKNNKGQALVEFILVLPVFLLIILGAIDVSNIVIKKYQIENKMDYIVELYKDDKLVQINNYVTSENLKIDYDSKTEYTEITLKDKTKVNTPILKDIIGSNYEIKTKRTIYEE